MLPTLKFLTLTGLSFSDRVVFEGNKCASSSKSLSLPLLRFISSRSSPLLPNSKKKEILVDPKASKNKVWPTVGCLVQDFPALAELICCEKHALFDNLKCPCFICGVHEFPGLKIDKFTFLAQNRHFSDKY